MAVEIIQTDYWVGELPIPSVLGADLVAVSNEKEQLSAVIGDESCPPAFQKPFREIGEAVLGGLHAAGVVVAPETHQRYGLPHRRRQILAEAVGQASQQFASILAVLSQASVQAS